jgi:hypothetical protein
MACNCPTCKGFQKAVWDLMGRGAAGWIAAWWLQGLWPPKKGAAKEEPDPLRKVLK